MRKRMVIVGITLLAALLAGLSGCDTVNDLIGGEAELKVFPLSLNLTVGGSEQSFTVTATDKKGNPEPFQAESDNTNIATVRLSGTKVYVTGVANGKTEIVVSSQSLLYKYVPVTVTGGSANAAPTANPSYSPTTPVAGDTLTLNANATDPDGDALSYAWSFTANPGAATLINATTAAPSFTASTAGTYNLSLTVSDNNSASVTKTLSIVVASGTPVNTAPTATYSYWPANPVAGETVTVNVDASDPDTGDTLSYAWSLTAKPAGSTANIANSTSAEASFYADLAGTYELDLVVSDGKGGVFTATLSIAVAPGTPANNPPTASPSYLPTSPVIGDTITLAANAEDLDDGDTLSYDWSFTANPGTMELDDNTAASPSFMAMMPGTYSLSLTVSDGNGGTVTKTLSIVVASGTPVNTAPVITTASYLPLSPVEGEQITLTAAASDADYDTLYYAWSVTGYPLGASDVIVNEASQTAYFTPTLAGDYDIVLTVSDLDAWDTEYIYITVAEAPNTSPTASPGYTPANPVAGATVFVSANANDDDGDELSYSWTFTTNPGAAGFADYTAAGTSFQAMSAGIYELNVTVSDGTDSVTEPLTIVVGEAPTTLPATPERPTVVDKGNDPTGATLPWVTLTWAEVAGATSYTVEVSADGGTTWTPTYDWPSAEITYNGLTEGAEYRFMVKAVNSEGSSDPSETLIYPVPEYVPVIINFD